MYCCLFQRGDMLDSTLTLKLLGLSYVNTCPRSLLSGLSAILTTGQIFKPAEAFLLGSLWNLYNLLGLITVLLYWCQFL